MTIPIRGWINLDDPVTFFPVKDWPTPISFGGTNATLVDLVPVVEPKSRACLTKRQREILEYCETCVRKEQHFPSLRQIAERFAIHSPNGVACHLKALEKKGFVTHHFAKQGFRNAWRLA